MIHLPSPSLRPTPASTSTALAGGARLAIAALLSAAAAACGALEEPIALCTVGDQSYAAGDSFPSEDGCNRCTCAEDGLVACTARACAPDRCVVDGVSHAIGDRFPSSDGCNTCSCQQGGLVACTERACVPTETCGGLLGAACDAGYFCDFAPDARCGNADQTGTCRPTPEVCTDDYTPVCGCDGRTYGNACSANSAGVSVAASGACGGDECGPDRPCPQTPCACFDEDGDGACDNVCAVGQCVAGRCQYDVPEPALGLGDVCGGFRPAGSPDCAAGLFCQHQAGALCGAADAPGECVAVPDACAQIFAPVCGCDGQTYSNACSAAAARVGIFELGACE